jgi:Holliday junction resolvasome RuvABC endonuclease subunit
VIVAGLDTSLTSTGLVIVGTADDYPRRVQLHRIESKAPITGRDQKTGKKLPPTLKQRLDRITDIEDRIVARLSGVELVTIESPSFGSVGSASRDLAGLWWRVVGKVDQLGIPVAEVSPSGRIKYALGTGRGDKDRVLAAVIKRYPDLDVTGNDIADALVLAAMGARWLGNPIEDSLPANHVAAMDGAHWPAGANQLTTA